LDKVQKGPGPSMRRVIALGAIGSTAEYYDFGLAVSTAALVWPTVFFPSGNPAAALALSFGSYGVSFLFQPVGALLFGHIGDRLGRKVPLLATLVAMGLGSLGLALTPSYASAGIAAPIMVVLLRMLQGIGFGGEWAGAVTWMAESAADSPRRGFWTSWVSVARTSGTLLATASFSYLATTMPSSDFVATGWRWLFVLGAVIVVIGFVIRRAFVADPLFEQAKRDKKIQKAPSLGVIRKYWARILGLALAYSSVVTVIVLFQGSFSLSYLAKLPGAHFTSAAVTMMLVFGRVWEIPVALASGTFADRVGRKRMVIVGTVGIIAAVLVMFPLMSTGSPAMIVLAFALTGIALNVVSAAVPSLLAESFPTQFRYSGTGLAFNIPSLVSGTVSTFIVPYLLATQGGPINAAPYVVAVAVGIGLVSLLFASRVKETLGANMRAE
jgi:MFS family permease